MSAETSLDLAPGQRTVVTLGNFDGLHLGHKAILDELLRQGRRHALPTVVLTFDPHPLHILRPDRALRLLMPVGERVEGLRELGVDHVFVLSFTEALSRRSAADFISDLVIARLHPKAFVVGPDTRFGHDRAGDATLLRAIGAREDFEVHEVGPVTVEGRRISSSGLRRLLAEGDVATAAGWLGRDYAVAGTVVPGRARGRTLGFPTANLQTSFEVVPRAGVYAVRCRLGAETGEALIPGVCNIGRRPTFEAASAEPTIEVHLLARALGALSGTEMRVHFVRRLRDERRFPSAEALVAQIRRDVGEARALLGAEAPT